MPELLEDFLKPSQSIDSADQRIINQANSLAENCLDKKYIMKKFFRFVRDNIIYENEPKKPPIKASRALVFGRGNSTEKACLLAALLRASGFPAGVKFIKTSGIKSIKQILLPKKWYGVTVVYHEGSWIKLDVFLPETDCYSYKNYKVIKESPIYLDTPPEIEIFY